jgi:Tol biopolymer transport system component
LGLIFAVVALPTASGSADQSAPLARSASVVFTRGTQQGLYLLNPVSHRVQRLTDGDDSEPRWSPDGRYIAFTRDRPRAIWILDYQSGSIHRLASGWSPVWSANGTTLYFLCVFESLCMRQDPTASHGLVTKRPLPLLTSEIDRSRDGRLILANLAGELWVWSIGGTVSKLTPSSLLFDSHPRFSSDGATVLFTRSQILTRGSARYRSDIESINLRTSKVRAVSRPGEHHVDDVASWIPGSDRIAFVRFAQQSSEVPTRMSHSAIETMTSDGRILSRLQSLPDAVYDLDWQP